MLIEILKKRAWANLGLGHLGLGPYGPGPKAQLPTMLRIMFSKIIFVGEKDLIL